MLPLSAAHAVRSGALPREHRDLFDQILVAQAMLEGLAPMSVDAELGEWCRVGDSSELSCPLSLQPLRLLITTQ